MNKLFTNALVMLSALTLTCSCGKDDKKDTPTPSTDPNTLILGDWKLDSYTSDQPVVWANGTAPTMDGFADMPACFLDNIVAFKSGGSYLITEGASKCTAGDDDLFYEATWNMAAYPTMIIEDDTVTIIQLDASTLKFTDRESVGPNGTRVTTTFALKR